MKKCASCGAKLPDDFSGVCAACLLEVGLSSEGQEQNVGKAATADEKSRSIHSEKPGDRIGRYKLLQQIGEGGCGVVYMAEQTEPLRRRVALKVIKLGMDTKQVIARFEAERQALALLDHTGISRIYDAGATDSGRPYFVMELVRGVKITDYCDQHSLTTRERLALFVQVCHAVQHAHQKGIIHRDLKPSNILITEQDGKSIPKIIDFGIAKATTAAPLTAQTLFTEFDRFIGTPAYMSPEQAGLGGLDIDTRSDIYSLGVLLYELLTGIAPFDPGLLRRSAIDDILRIIREQEPPRPSVRLTNLTNQEKTVVARCRQTDPARFFNLLRGDLDWIVMKSMEKDRARRYETAQGLLRDIEGFLNNEPVTAGPPGNLYRLQKWTRRNTLVFVSLSLIFASLIAGFGVSIWMYSKERASHRHAMDETQRATIAERQARDQLWQSRLSEARTELRSHRAGRRSASLELLRKAAEYRPSIELRNEAIAALAIADLHPVQKSRDDHSAGKRAAFDSAFARYVTSDEHGNAILCDAKDDHEVMSFPGIGSEVSEFLFSPDNRWLAIHYTTNKLPVRVWDLTSRQAIALQPPITNCRALNFSPDSRELVVAEFEIIPKGLPEPILLYDLQTGRPKQSFPVTALPWGLRLDSTGRRLAISSQTDPNVLVEDVETGQKILSLTHPSGVQDLAWSDSGGLLATACMNGSVYLWDMASGNLLRSFSGHESSARGVRINHGENLLASTGWDGHLRLWNLLSGSEICNWPFDREQYEVVFSADDRWLRHCGWSTEHGLFEVEGGNAADVLRFLGTGSAEVWQCSFSPDSKVLASMHGNHVRFWDTLTGAKIAVQSAEKVRSVTFDQTGRSLFVGCEQGLQQWNLDGGIGSSTNELKVSLVQNLSDRPDLDRFSRPVNPKAGKAALVSNGEIHLIDLATRREITKLGEAMRADFACLSDDGRWCAASSFKDEVVTVFDLTASNTVHVLPAALQDKTMAFSPDSRRLVVGDAKEYKFWDTASWQCVSTVGRDGTGGRPGAISFSPDGKTVAVAFSSQLVRLVNVEDGVELATLESSAPQDICWIEFNPDGSQLAVIGFGHNHYIQLWNIRTLRKELASMKLDW